MYKNRLKKNAYIVRPLGIDAARTLVESHHYARGASNTAVAIHGLFPAGSFEPLGVCWWLPPTKSAALATYPESWRAVLALSRLVVVPGVPKNAASFLLSRSMKMIDRHTWPCLVTYADEWQGHVGTIYRATNWTYVGMTKPQPTYVMDGRMISRKAGPVTRTHKEMIDMGCEFLGKHAKHKFIHVIENAQPQQPKMTQGALFDIA